MSLLSLLQNLDFVFFCSNANVRISIKREQIQANLYYAERELVRTEFRWKKVIYDIYAYIDTDDLHIYVIPQL